MGFKVILEEYKEIAAGTVTQPATQAVDLGQYREVAVVYDVASVATDTATLKLQTAIEPFEGSFVDVSGSSTTYTTAESGRKMLYVNAYARYLRWKKEQTTGTIKLNRIELYAKEPA
ncbi:MAG: hypothetical protein FJ125_01720 [Deltaproteobacteria bacterium]|nr:hypothetical protein [Deltaproteobacteria bacterium]